MKNRALNRTYARLNDYFWLPCPLCGQAFGGHEWVPNNEYHTIETVPGRGQCICPDCGAKREAKALKKR